jgi:glycosyltransferase involved in cell wall biosynthesis
MAARALIQRISIRRARLLICISSVFRDHLVADYGFPVEATTVVPNPVRISRFSTAEGQVGEPPRVLVLGRVSTRKGIEDVVAVAKTMRQREVDMRLTVAGGPTLWSDYTKLLEDLPSENADYVGSVSAAEVPQLMLDSDILLQASKFEPFALTVAEALAAGVPVVATTEVGAIEGVDASVAYVVAPGDVDGMATAIEALMGRLVAEPAELRRTARAEAERLFAPDVVCGQISSALIRLVGGPQHDVSSGDGNAPARPPLRA